MRRQISPPAAWRQAIEKLISTQPPRTRAILVSVPARDMPQVEADEHIEELGRLADTAGASVEGTIRQRLDAPHPKYYIGEGKVGELRGLMHDTQSDLVIFDEDLTPAQGKNLEDVLGARIMDRTELILDIFATRARTAEAKMQVELAQLQYMLPRLKRMWTHLSRTRGGVGAFRGPGETQLETDRRLIGRRIRELRTKLEAVARQRATQRKGRVEELRVALVGYTNAGKSSILRSLSGAEVFVEDRLFATLDPATRVVDLGSVGRVLATDTVGFIRHLPHHLVASFRATLEEAVEADLLLHVIDASYPSWAEQKSAVEEVLASLGLEDRRTLLVFNKRDRLTHQEESELRQRVTAQFGSRFVFVSAIEDGGLDELREVLRAEVRARRPEVRVAIPLGDGEAVATVYREGEVLGREQNGATIDFVVRLPEAILGRLRRREGVTVTDGA